MGEKTKNHLQILHKKDRENARAIPRPQKTNREKCWNILKSEKEWITLCCWLSPVLVQ